MLDPFTFSPARLPAFPTAPNLGCSDTLESRYQHGFSAPCPACFCIPELPREVFELPGLVPPSLAPWVSPSWWATSTHPAWPQHVCSRLFSCYHRRGVQNKTSGKLEQLYVGLGSPEHSVQQLLPPEQLLLSARKTLLPAPALKLSGRSFALGRDHSNSSKGQNHSSYSACVCFGPLGACLCPASSGYQEDEPSILLQKS